MGRGGLWLMAVTAAGLLACGPTVGDPCTTSGQCAGDLCLNAPHTPGGYCSVECGDGCPTGTSCVEGAAGGQQAACFLGCERDSQCREGYRCLPPPQGGDAVCVGASGFPG